MNLHYHILESPVLVVWLYLSCRSLSQSAVEGPEALQAQSGPQTNKNKTYRIILVDCWTLDIQYTRKGAKLYILGNGLGCRAFDCRSVYVDRNVK